MSKKVKMTLTIDSDIKEALNLMKKNVATYYSNVSVSYLIEYMTKLIIHRYLNDEQLFIEFNDELKEELKALGFDEKTFKTMNGEEFEKHLDLENKVDKNETIIKKQQVVIDKLKKEIAREEEKLNRTREKVNNQKAMTTTTIKRVNTRKQKEDELKELSEALDYIKFVDSSDRTQLTISVDDYNEHFDTNEAYFDISNDEQLENLKELARYNRLKIILDGKRFKSQMVMNVRETEATENNEGGEVVTEVRVKDISKELEFENHVKEREAQREKLKEQTKQAIERLEKAKSLDDYKQNEEFGYEDENENDIYQIHEFKVNIIRRDGSHQTYEFDEVELKENDLKNSKSEIIDTIMKRLEKDSRKNTVLRKLINDYMTEDIVQNILDETIKNETEENIGLITIDLDIKDVTFQMSARNFEVEEPTNQFHEFYLQMFNENGEEKIISIEKLELKSDDEHDYHINYNKPIIVNQIVEEMLSMGIEEFEIDNLIENELTDEIIEAILDNTAENKMSEEKGLLTVDIEYKKIDFAITEIESSDK